MDIISLLQIQGEGTAHHGKIASFAISIIIFPLVALHAVFLGDFCIENSVIFAQIQTEADELLCTDIYLFASLIKYADMFLDISLFLGSCLHSLLCCLLFLLLFCCLTCKHTQIFVFVSKNFLFQILLESLLSKNDILVDLGCTLDLILLARADTDRTSQKLHLILTFKVVSKTHPGSTSHGNGRNHVVIDAAVLIIILALVSLLDVSEEVRSDDKEPISSEIYGSTLFYVVSSVITSRTIILMLSINIHLIAICKRKTKDAGSSEKLVLHTLTKTMDRNLATLALVGLVKSERTKAYVSVFTNFVLKLLESDNHILCSCP